MPAPEVEIFSPEEISGENSSFNMLIFRQLERVNYLFSQTLATNQDVRKEKYLDLYQSIRSLETLMWARLGRDKKYLERRKQLGFSNAQNFSMINQDTLSSLMKFSEALDRWYKAITWRLDRFNFFPPIDLYNFTNLTDLKNAQAQEDTQV